jgi:DNA polymerase-3 subunit alpha
VKFIAEARAHGILVMRPDVNESDAQFTVVRTDGPAEGSAPAPAVKQRKSNKSGPAPSKAIRFGLAAVKGVGEGAVEVTRTAREAGGPFLSMVDFCARVDPRKVNRKVLECLVKSGGFDGIAAKNGVSRSKMFLAIPAAAEAAAAAQRERESGQTSLLALLAGKTAGRHAPIPSEDAYADGEEWTPKDKLAFEKESLGFYISGHPLDRFAGELKRFANATTANSVERGPRAEVILGGVVCDFQERMAKSGSGKYAFFKLEDQFGQIEISVGGQKLVDHRNTLTSGEPLLVTALVDTPFGDGETARERLRFMDARPLTSIRAERSSLIDIRLNADRLTEESLGTLHKLLLQFPGPCRTRLRLEIPQRSETLLELGEDFKVAASEELLAKLEQVFGDRVAVLR